MKIFVHNQEKVVPSSKQPTSLENSRKKVSDNKVGKRKLLTFHSVTSILLFNEHDSKCTAHLTSLPPK